MMINSLTRTCLACPSQWEGTTIDGQVFYGRYRWGTLTLGFGKDLDEAINNSQELQVDNKDSMDGFMTTKEFLIHALAAHHIIDSRIIRHYEFNEEQLVFSNDEQ